MPLPRLGDISQQAEAYARSRPGYPDQLIDLLLADIGLKPGDPVAEIGAGTGLFTRQLAGRGLEKGTFYFPALRFDQEK